MDETGSELDLRQAGELLGMAPTALHHLLASGGIASHVAADGRSLRVLESDVDAYRAARFALRQRLAGQARDRRAGVWESTPLSSAVRGSAG